MSISYITTPAGRRLAYRQNAAEPGKASFIWLSGFNSDMSGTKVLALEAWAKTQGHGFLAFDYSGHGQSGGAFADGTIGIWRDDMLAAIDQLSDGPQILVGSSMGGWMALLATLARPTCIAGLVLIAPAPDFTERLMWPSFPPEVQREILETGVYLHPSDYGEPYPITRALIEDGRNWQVLTKPMAFQGPVRILQGLEDPDVPPAHAERLITHLTTPDLIFTMIKDGDHRLSRPQDLDRLIATCGEVAMSILV